MTDKTIDKKKKPGHPCHIWAAEYNLSKAQMALNIGVDVKTYRDMISGDQKPSTGTILKIEIATNGDVGWSQIIEWQNENITD